MTRPGRPRALLAAALAGAFALGACTVSGERPVAAAGAVDAAATATAAASRAGFMTYFAALTLFNKACLKTGPTFGEADAVFAAEDFSDLSDFDLWGDYQDGLFGSVWATSGGDLYCVVIIEQGGSELSAKAMSRLIERRYGAGAYRETAAPEGVHQLWTRRHGAAGPQLGVTEPQFFNSAVFGVALTAGAAPDLTRTRRPEPDAASDQEARLGERVDRQAAGSPPAVAR